MNKKSRSMSVRVQVSLALAVFVASCAGGQQVSKEVDKRGRQVAAGGIYKIGTPYQIAGEWYYPQEDTSYDNTGIASWYGPKFDGRRTANGEIFDMNLMTAAHPTLPMPVRARVTNLANGRSVIVRVNDRGPFAKDREIDMSRRAAEALGFLEQGTTEVRVQYLGRAPLYDAAGRLIRGAEPERFVVDKPITPAAQQQVGAAPTAKVVAQTLDGKPVETQKPEKAVSDARYAVQVGVFSSRDNAEMVRQKLNDFAPVEIVEVDINRATYYRVKLGGANIRADARATLERVQAAGHADAIVIEQ